MSSTPEPSPSGDADLLDLRIDRLAYGGDGVGRDESGRTVFVPFTAPGDRVTARVTEAQKRFARARAVEWSERSPSHCAPFCPHFGVCGGCHLQHLEQSAQLHWKHLFVRDALTRIGKLQDPNVAPVPAPAADRGYRCHAVFSVSMANRQAQVGFQGTDNEGIVEVEECPLLVPLLNQVLGVSRQWLREHAAQLAQRELGGSLRWLDVRASSGAEECTVALWCHSQEFELAGKLAAHLVAVEPRVRGVCLVVFRGRQRQSDGKATVMSGTDSIREQVRGLELQVSAQSFYQGNPAEAIRLLEAALNMSPTAGAGDVVELYAGVGYFTLPLSVSAKSLVALEGRGSAIRDLKRNMEFNGIHNVRLRRGDAAEQLGKLAAKKGGRPQQVWLDPPRTGAGERVIRAVCELGPESVVYISCDPTTMSRDLGLLTQGGYVLEEARPFDLFAQTFHVETVALLRRP
ncbi:MAG: 23S rRNA (uracil(1939)-C(5))-methyltransferase RlmD [Armatimonadetes bacterium CG_4_10_14_3_um_filter_66_18]|nr:23S rRNA (uracil(1939)-C(5))-methyltransferase RlmD [Armatimonadota bacterium]PIU91950.1 MAG: 23S rRNA (uracil(1939)-C(5))-methyltransferase RlmD [Armatimonadetes bacterium CG06_land_8_20_14_3_00_66_21]PIW12824.1 MAG: 23S rRNA (uracil(1939)-C(5))-methyltransferase RlmD [Armatimonadetes bacterium CG17_big_fil_post_rev_8_21_14_2_50_66_6]PIX39336.1 MAG: 23S rRNA (uracil(1939)-C(5))-methyltransferase RlmD [Armatimonadetes bacterium CG_4_8_14_3_um_filter_66_20]PIY51259.1 MAG: 23S rRNA (uracil(193